MEAALLPSLAAAATSSSSTPATAAAMTDRAALIGQLADRALDFLLQYLPSLPLPPLEGATEDNAVAYKVEGLDLGGVRLRRVRGGLGWGVGWLGLI